VKHSVLDVPSQYSVNKEESRKLSGHNSVLAEGERKSVPRKAKLTRRMDVAAATRNSGSNLNSIAFPRKSNRDEITKDAAMIAVRLVTYRFKAFAIAGNRLLHSVCPLVL